MGYLIYVIYLVKFIYIIFYICIFLPIKIMPSHYKKFKPRSKMKMVIYFLWYKNREHFMSVEGATDKLPEDGHETCKGGEGDTAQR